MISNILITWLDVQERFYSYLKNYSEWPENFLQIEVYWDGVLLKIKTGSYEFIVKWLEDLFPERIKNIKGIISIRLEKREEERLLPIEFEESDGESEEPKKLEEFIQNIGSNDGINKLKDNAAIYIDKDKSDNTDYVYLPDIYRRGLGFDNSNRGGRSKILSIYRKAKLLNKN
jgi:hypothetical protein